MRLALILLVACSPKAKQKINVIYDGKTAFACDATDVDERPDGITFGCDGRKLEVTFANGRLTQFALPNGDIARTVDATDYDCPDAPIARPFVVRDGTYRFDTADPCAVLTLVLKH